MSAVRHVTIEKFHDLTGYTPDAVRSKIKRGDWLEGVLWHKAPDGRVLIDLGGFDWWVLNGNQASAALQIQPLRSTSTTAVRGVGSG